MLEHLVNGQPARSIPADDRAFLYGDQLFETIAFRAGRAPLWQHHMARLKDSAPRLFMPVPDPELLAAECRLLLGERGDGVVRISLSRGSGGHAFEPLAEPSLRRVLTRRKWPEHLEEQRKRGLVVHRSPVRLAESSGLAGIKHGNRLEQVLAAEHARRAGVDEALVFATSGELIESIAGNVVLLVDGAALTPILDRAGVAGVGLSWLEQAADGAISRARLHAVDIDRAEAILMINSIAGIRPVRMLDERALTIPPLVRRWQQLWEKLFECAG